jgi:hypothetical protein
MFFTISNCVFNYKFYWVDPWQFSVRFDPCVYNDVWYEYETVCKDAVSASDSDGAAVISSVI